MKIQLHRDLQRFMIVEVSGAPVEGIEALIARHALRGKTKTPTQPADKTGHNDVKIIILPVRSIPSPTLRLSRKAFDKATLST